MIIMIKHKLSFNSLTEMAKMPWKDIISASPIPSQGDQNEQNLHVLVLESKQLNAGI